MEEAVYPAATKELAQRREELAPATHRGVSGLQQAGVRRRRAGAEDQAADRRRRRSCHPVPLLHPGHTRAALRKGATQSELMEAIWVAAEMRAGGAYAHSLLALDTAAHIHPEGSHAA